MEKFVAFYPSRPFWLDGEPDLKKFGPENYDVLGFYKEMSKIIFKFNKNDYTVSICKDGLVMLSKHLPDDLETTEKWSIYLSILNALYLLLESSVIKSNTPSNFEISEITNKDSFGLEYDDGQLKGHGIPMYSYAEKYALGRWLNSYDLSDPKYWYIYDRRLKDRFNISISSLVDFRESLNFLFSEEPIEGIKILSDITKSISQYKILNFDTSMILAWVVIEKYINVLWDRFLTSDPMLIDKQRGQLLKDNRTYSASVKAEILQFNGLISIDLYRRITDARQTRNGIMHINNRKKCESADCINAIEIIKYFIQEEMGIQLEINMGYAFNGI